jgi:hypothetical protein
MTNMLPGRATEISLTDKGPADNGGTRDEALRRLQMEPSRRTERHLLSIGAEHHTCQHVASSGMRAKPTRLTMPFCSFA